MRFLRYIALFVICCLRVSAATGDITGVAIETNGWQALVYISGMATGGTYSFGLGSSNSYTGNESIKIDLTSQGFDDSGTATTVGRRVVGTYRVRKPVPNESQADEFNDGSTLRLRVSLDRLVYSGDSNLTATIASGLYIASSVTNNAASSVTVTNNSQIPYPQVVASWSWPGWQHITNSSFTLRALAFHQSAQQGRPVRMVRFIASDESGDAFTNDVLRPTIDRTVGDSIPFAEYIGTLSGSAFGASNIITARFIAYPWIGDTNAILDTANITNSQPTPYPANQLHLYDGSGAYGTTHAVVATNGNNSTGQAVNSTFWATNQNPNAFATIAGAFTAIAASNNTWYSRNDVGAGQVYLKAGNHAWAGGSGTYGLTPRTWGVVQPYPGVAKSDAVISSQSGNKDISDRVLVKGVTITAASASGVFDGIGAFWTDDCMVSSGTHPMSYQNPVWFITRCTLTNHTQGFSPFSTVNMAPAIVRGNNIRLGSNGGFLYTVVGNTIRFVSASLVEFISTASALPTPRHRVLFNNWLLTQYTGNSTVLLSPNGPTYTNATAGGLVVANNLMEAFGNTAQPILHIAADGGTTNSPVDNVMIWNNTIVGQRINSGYNDSGSSAPLRRQWSISGNYSDDYNIKTDTFATTNAARIGNWEPNWSVGHFGNSFPEIANIGATPDFLPDFYGVNSYVSAVTNAVTYPRFTDRRSYDGSVTNTGGGNYRLLSDSPLFRYNSWLLSHDIQGFERGAADPPGAYISGNVKKGGGF